MTVKGMPPRELTTFEIAKHYLENPGALLRVVFNTITSASLLKFYWASFIGVLGWLDTPLAGYVYAAFGILLPLLLISSFWGRTIRFCGIGHLALGCGALLSLTAMFVIELLSWTPFPAEIIDGVQGRYFTPILIVLGYATLSPRPSSFEGKCALPIVLLTLSFSIASMVPKLLDRYWLH
jgi:uncharacterized membrane protein